MPHKPAARGRRGQQQPAEEELGDGRGWPMLRRQQELMALLPDGEAAAAERRAQALVCQGWGALQPWLEHPGPHPGERPQMGAAADLISLFDEAA